MCSGRGQRPLGAVFALLSLLLSFPFTFYLWTVHGSCRCVLGQGLGAFLGSGDRQGPGRGAARPVHLELTAAVWPTRPEGGMEQEQFRELPRLVDRAPEVWEVTAASGEDWRAQRTSPRSARGSSGGALRRGLKPPSRIRTSCAETRQRGRVQGEALLCGGERGIEQPQHPTGWIVEARLCFAGTPEVSLHFRGLGTNRWKERSCLSESFLHVRV